MHDAEPDDRDAKRGRVVKAKKSRLERISIDYDYEQMIRTLKISDET